MNINYTFKNFEPSDHLKDYAKTRFEKISKYTPKDVGNAELQVSMSVERFRHMAEVVLYHEDLHISAYHESEDMYATIDMVLDKLEAQVKKVKERQKGKRRQARSSVRTETFSFSPPSEDGTRDKTIVDTDSYEPKPMDVQEAAMQLENLKYDFLVFRNAENDRVNVIYQKKNNDFGLIDPGV